MDTFIRLQEQAYAYLKEMITSGKFSQDIIYSETKIAEEIKISRTPVRDALQRLNQDGFIDILPSKGFILHKMTLHDVLETYQTRCALEGYCTLMITREITTKRAQQWILQLKDMIAEMEQILTTTSDLNHFADVDRLFHSTIVAYVQNDGFNELFHKYMYRISTMAIKSLEEEGRPQKAMQEHRNILTAMQRGDVEHIYDITIQHMESPKRIIINRFFGVL
jgi:DNA-binding GntR family transcriptional regulator